MYLLYADESGSITDAGQKYFVLAGLSVFERDPHWIEQKLNKIAARFEPDQPQAIELHGSPMRTGKSGWRRFSLVDREQAILDALRVGVAEKYPQVRLFAVVLKKANFSGKNIAQVAFEQLSSRFDHYLRRLHLQQNTHRGLILFDKSSTEQRIQTLAQEFKYSGHSYGRIRNYAEVPVFIDSHASRLIQLADLVAYAIYRKYEHDEDSYFKVIADCFDAEGGVVHGLYVR